jgi:regulator of sirC expression with transglutaminase-like and TPR domain
MIMKKKDIQALIHLLDDPDAEVSDVVTGNLRMLGTEIIPELESAWEKAPDSNYQEKIENIIQSIQFNNVIKNLRRWKESGAEDILEGAFWIARYQYPEIEISETEQKIHGISRDIWLELSPRLTALEKVRIMNHIIFNVHKFTRNKNIHSPRNSYINQVLESKKGNAVSLAILYMLVARELRIPIMGVSMPKIFILAYMDEPGPLRIALQNAIKKKASPKDVLFYINPYNSGAVLGKKEIDHYLQIQKLEPEKSWYAPCSNEETIKRLLLNLIISYEKSGFPEKVNDLQELMKIFIIK